MPVIQQFIKPGSTVISDQWAGYSEIGQYSYQHLTINHSEPFVDQSTKAQTQNIDCTLSHTKGKLKRMRSTTRDLLETYLVELKWRRNSSPSGPALRRSQTSSDTSTNTSRSNCSFHLIWTFQFDLFQLVAHFNAMIMSSVRQMLLNFPLRFQSDVAVLSVLCRSFSLCFVS